MNRQIILLTIFVLSLLGAGYAWYRYAELIPAEPEVQEDFTVSVLELRRLKTLELDVAIFQDPLFRSLGLPPEVLQSLASLTKPGTTTAPEARLGRPNPFLPF